MKEKLMILLLLLTAMHGYAQIKWSEDKNASDVEWNNYSTTYLGDIDKNQPLLVAAIPYNGVYDNSDVNANAPLDITYSGSLYRFKSMLSNKGQHLCTYDSGNVYFLTPGIFAANASNYEYRILLNGKTVIKAWSAINQFSDLDLNTFKKGFGFLGGYKASWGDYISAELRKKNEDSSFALTTVYWKEVKPSVSAIFTTKNLNEFFTLLQRPWDNKKPTGYSSKDLVLPSTENTIIFYLSADIYKKEALEYCLIKDDKVLRNWAANDYDNNFIWLKELSPGKYKLQVRYSRQRQSVSTYEFEIKPQWQQTTSFKIIMGSLLAAFLGFIILLFRSAYQKRKLKEAEAQKEKLKLSLQSVRAQLNPHFIFNALSSIQSLINKNNSEAAGEYLSAFSSLLRRSLQFNDQEYIAVQQEADMLTTYLKLEQLRFPFVYDIILDNNVASADIPAFIVQPLVENAVKHGISGGGQEGKIIIHFFSDKKNLCIEIRDNGKGFDTSAESTGYGIKLTQQRIDLLNMHEQKAEMLVNSKPGEGTIILLTLINWL